MKNFSFIKELTKNTLRLFFRQNPRIDAKSAYDMLALDYDKQGFNLLHLLDEATMNSYLQQFEAAFENTLDYGAGTGRNIPILKKMTTKSLMAYDLSRAMLKQLRRKYPQVQIILTDATGKLQIPHRSLDLICCNLTLGYLDSLDEVLTEWDRLLKPNGHIIISDMHPSLNRFGNSRNFWLKGQKLTIQSKAYSQRKLNSKFRNKGWKILHYGEVEVTEHLRNQFADPQTYSLFLGKKILFNYLLSKP